MADERENKSSNTGERENKSGQLSEADVEAHSKSTFPKDSAPKEDDDGDDVEAHYKGQGQT
jgi:hypothetical protein